MADQFRIFASRRIPGMWCVETDPEDEPNLRLAMFGGVDAEVSARAYHAWRNGKPAPVDVTLATPTAEDPPGALMVRVVSPGPGWVDQRVAVRVKMDDIP